MFTLNDIRQIAIQIEHNGEKAYRSAAGNSNDDQIRLMFNWMADEEMRHAEWFENLQNLPEASPAHEEIETMGRSLLQEMMRNQTFSLENERMEAVTDIPSLVDLSLEFENDTILFYEMLRAFIEDSDTIGQLEVVIEEEKGHVRQLERLKKAYADRVKEGNRNL